MPALQTEQVFPITIISTNSGHLYQLFLSSTTGNLPEWERHSSSHISKSLSFPLAICGSQKPLQTLSMHAVLEELTARHDPASPSISQQPLPLRTQKPRHDAYLLKTNSTHKRQTCAFTRQCAKVTAVIRFYLQNTVEAQKDKHLSGPDAGQRSSQKRHRGWVDAVRMKLGRGSVPERNTSMHRDRVKSAWPMGLFDATRPPAPRPRDFAQQTLVRFVRQLLGWWIGGGERTDPWEIRRTRATELRTGWGNIWEVLGTDLRN